MKNIKPYLLAWCALQIIAYGCLKIYELQHPELVFGTTFAVTSLIILCVVMLSYQVINTLYPHTEKSVSEPLKIPTKTKYWIGGLIVMLTVMNPSEKNFERWSKAHGYGSNTTREYNFIVASIYYNGSYYLGILGAFISID